MPKFYAVLPANSNKGQIFTEWNECQKAVHGQSGVIYKSFTIREDASNFLISHGAQINSPPKETITQEIDFSSKKSIKSPLKSPRKNITAGFTAFTDFSLEKLKSPGKRKIPSKFYAVIKNNQGEIYTDWKECQKATAGVSNVIFKGFYAQKEAEDFIDKICGPHSSTSHLPGTIIYTDGSGKGGYGIVILPANSEDKITAYGKLPFTGTSQTAELYAIYVALSLVSDENITLFTDSFYAISNLTAYYNPVKNNTALAPSSGVNGPASTSVKADSGGKKIPNSELLDKILDLMKGRQIKFHHVYGHTGNEYNEECDELASLGSTSNKTDVIIYKNGVKIR